GVRNAGIQHAEVAVGHCGGLLHIAECLHEVRLLAHGNAGDVEVLAAADGLDAVIDVVGDLARSEEILLRAAHGRSLFLIAAMPRCRHSGAVTTGSVRQASGLRCRRGISTFGEQVWAASLLRLLPSL